jgi:hypothetical protein
MSQFLVNPGLSNTSVDEIIFTMEGFPTSSTWLQQVFAYNGSFNTIINNQYSANASTVPVGSLSFPTRMATSNPTTTAGYMVMIFTLPGPINASLSSGTYPYAAFVYPAIPTLNAYNASSISSAVSESVSGLIAGYQGRVVAFMNTLQVWPSGLIANNENICYTDPSNSDSIPSEQDIVLVPENPYGYSAAGSISAGELFLVKKFGGGAVLTGDMNNPNVVYLPGVQPGGGMPSNAPQANVQSPLFSNSFFGQCASSMNGLYYCSGDNGAWLWNGGNSSSKISQQLNNNFYFDPSWQFASLGYYICRWGEYLMFSNNWMYHERLGSWWRIAQGSEASLKPYFWYGVGKENSTLYASPASFGAAPNAANYRLYDTFNIDTANDSWQWTSQPIRVSENKEVSIREISIKAICPTSSTLCSIVVNIIDQAGNVNELNTITSMSNTGLPTVYRIPCGIRTQYATIQIQSANGSGAQAPSVYSIGIGYREREHVGTVA